MLFFSEGGMGVMKYAAIDIGTNTMRLLIAEVSKGKITRKEKWIFPTRMGEGLGTDRVIPLDVMDRNLKALAQAGELCRENGADEIFAFGTSALRDAKNGKEFVQKALEQTGIQVEIISGELESTLAYLGIAGSMERSNMLILDVGGGSSEWVVVRKGAKEKAQSINVGAVRLKEGFVRNDPPTMEEKMEMESYVQDIFQQAWGELDLEGLTAVGIGGTATTMSAMNQKMEVYQSEKIHNTKVEAGDMARMLDQLSALTLERRKNIPGLQPSRADVIIPGMLIVMGALAVAKKDLLYVSDSDNLEGAIYHKINSTMFDKKY